jgi:hypothetical protein
MWIGSAVRGCQPMGTLELVELNFRLPVLRSSQHTNTGYQIKFEKYKEKKRNYVINDEGGIDKQPPKKNPNQSVNRDKEKKQKL